jgi:hypothetical protein
MDYDRSGGGRICSWQNTKKFQGRICHSAGIKFVVCSKHEEKKMSEKEPSANYWKVWYLAVLGFLVLQILFFGWLTDYFR